MKLVEAVIAFARSSSWWRKNPQGAGGSLTSGSGSECGEVQARPCRPCPPGGQSPLPPGAAHGLCACPALQEESLPGAAAAPRAPPGSIGLAWRPEKSALHRLSSNNEIVKRFSGWWRDTWLLGLISTAPFL